MKQVYLDYAAATPLSQVALRAMEPYLTDQFYNPSALYLSARQVRADLEAARDDAARVIGVRASEIIFTAGGTESNNLAISGIMENYKDKEIIATATEHDSVLEPVKRYGNRLVAVRPDGLIDLDALERHISEDTVMISVHYVNNEIGSIQPLRKIRTIIDKILAARRQNGNKLPLYLHTDACQAGNYASLLVHSLGADMMTINGGKIYGPKQSGLLYVRAGIQLEPMIRGGGQEFSLRSGTENVPAIMGMVAALKAAQNKRESEMKRLQQLQAIFINRLLALNDTIKINGSLEHRIVNNIHATFPGADNERLMMQLDEVGIMCAVGSACSASKDKPSHVLSAIGLSDAEARSSLRMTMGAETTEEQIDYVCEQLGSIL